MLLTRRLDFAAAHRLHAPSLGDAENAALFGRCNNPHGHGHNYVLEVSLDGSPDPATGMIYDLKDLKEIMMREVIDPMDHRHLNFEVPPFDKVIPSTENLTLEIWRRLEPHFAGGPARLHTVRLWETDEIFAEYSGK